MKKIDNKIVRSILIIFLALSLVAAFFYVIALYYSFDFSIGHFVSSTYSWSRWIALSIVLIMAAFSVVFWIISRKTSVSPEIEKGSSSFFSLFTHIFVGFVFVAAGIYSFYEIFAQKQDFLESTPILKILIFLYSITYIVSGFYFIFRAVSDSTSKKWIRVMSLFPIIWAILKLMATYFDYDIAMNSELKFMLQMIFLSFAIYFTASSGCIIYYGKNFLKN